MCSTRGRGKEDARIVSHSSLTTKPLCAKHLAQINAYLLFGVPSSPATPNKASASLSKKVLGTGVDGAGGRRGNCWEPDGER